MIINVKSGKSGWSEYVLKGTKRKPRDQSKVMIIDGDYKIGDLLSDNNKYEESYYKLIIAFSGKPSDDIILNAYNDFKKDFFIGFKNSEFHIDAVVHKDTSDYHIHVRIPKQNLLTNTHLQLFFDPIDRKRKELIQDSISLKYNFPIARETSREVVIEKKHDHIQTWRKEHSQPVFMFDKKKDRKDSQIRINEYLVSLFQSNMLKEHSEIKTNLEEMGLSVIRFGRDIKKDFAYVTVENTTGKMRIQGEFYDKSFWDLSIKEMENQINLNKRNFDSITVEERIIQVRKDLKKENEKRFKKVQELFNVSRQKAESESNDFLFKYGKYNPIAKNEGANYESSEPEIRRRIDDSRTNTENIIRRIREKRNLIYQSIESNFERQYSKERSNISKSKENLESIRGVKRRVKLNTESINTSTTRVITLVREINDYVKEIIKRFKPKDFFTNIIRRQR